MRYAICLLAVLAVALLLREPRAAEQPRRVPWTTSKLTGSPEPPPPYQVELAFPHVKFTRPVTMARAPGSPAPRGSLACTRDRSTKRPPRMWKASRGDGLLHDASAKRPELLD